MISYCLSVRFFSWPVLIRTCQIFWQWQIQISAYFTKCGQQVHKIWFLSLREGNLGGSCNLDNLICFAHSVPFLQANEAMEDPSILSYSHRERYKRLMEDSCCTHFCIGPNPYMARYVYGLLFLVTSLLAWTIRDYGHEALSELKSKLLLLLLLLSDYRCLIFFVCM